MNAQKKIFLAQNTCMNASYDVNVLREGFRQAGYILADTAEDADEIVFAGCGAHRTWVDDAIGQINRISAVSPNAKVTVTGCLAGIDADRVRRNVQHEGLSFARHQDVLKSYTGIDFDEIDRTFDQDSTLNYEGDSEFNQLRIRVGVEKANVVAELQKIDREHGLLLEKYYRRTTKGFVFYRENEMVEMITVTRSCPYKCSFCAIPQGRGAYTSVPLNVILEKAQAALRRGVKRLVLLGDEVGNYGADLRGPKLQEMVEAVLALDPGLTLSIRYIEPKPFAKNFAMFERLCGEGRIELLYLPIQSGSQQVLTSMNRGYQLERIVPYYQKLRQNSDTIFFCNWMVGFPGETDDDFEATRALMLQLGLQINIAVPYSERPNTPAPLMPNKIPETLKEQRLIDLRGTIVDMKRREFEQKLHMLDPGHRNTVLDLIALAESIHVDDFASGASDAISA